MNKALKGILAGLVATVVLSILMMMKSKMGLMPDIDVISMLASNMGGSAKMGWLAHFMIGTLGYGLAYAFVFSKLPLCGHVSRGILLGITGWLMMMVVVMPMMGAGLFGMAMPSGVMVPVMTLMLHVIFGAVLGFTFAKQYKQSAPPTIK
ncbi:MAG: DUF6789 family protein [Gallionella sp.]